MLDKEQSAQDIEAAIERLLALGHRPCPTCNAETVTSRDGAVVVLKVLHDDWCPALGSDDD